MKKPLPHTTDQKLAMFVEYARLLRFAWLNPDDEEAAELLNRFEEDHRKALGEYLSRFQDADPRSYELFVP